MTLPRPLARLRGLFRRDALDADMDEELRFHLEMETRRNLELGMAPEEAARQARLSFGGVERVKEELRDGDRARWLEGAWQDTRYAARTLRKSPGFTLVAAATLGLGIGAATVAFGAVDGILLRPLPYPDPERLVRIFQQSGPDNRWGVSVADYLAISEQQRSFESVALFRIGSATLTGGGEPEWVNTAPVTTTFLRTLGVTPAAGRGFAPGDEAASAPLVAVVTHAFAERRFGTPARAVGQTLVLDGTAHTVVGVLPASVRDLAGWRADIWPVLRPEAPERRGPFSFRAFARLRPGVTHAAAARDLAGISERIFPIWQAGFQDRQARLTPVPLREAIVGNAGRSLAVFAGAVALVLLIAVANVANLVLVRSVGRQREIALRAALGAGRGTLARLLLAESLLLGLLGTAVGLALAAAGVRLLAVAGPWLPRLDQVRLDLRAAGFAAAAALVSAALVGAYPLLVGLRRDLASSVRSGGRGASQGRAARLFQGALVVTEFGLALPLLMGAGLLLHSFARLQEVDLGFDPERLSTARVTLPSLRYPEPPDVVRFWNEALRSIQDLPGVSGAALAQSLPPDNQGDVNNFDLLDRPVEPGGAEHVAPWVSITPDFFATLGVPLLEGRLFGPADTAGAPPVVVVSRAWAGRYYPGESVLGRRMRAGGCAECEPTVVVGVVDDVKYQGIGRSAEAVYSPFAQNPMSSLNLVVRSTLAPEAAAAAVQRRMRALDPDLALQGTGPMEANVQASLSAPRRWAGLVGGFAAVAVALAALGIFGVMSYTVAQQRREIGV
ncbi:MAG TPA: ADOP family duplicated permease, partial [Longimicrobiaceae bacterium]|nr:ADOP family duplicated permease [Longimicrobiaceae bacterium]